MSRKRPSGSPSAWSERRKAYKATQKAVSNPGQPNFNSRRNKRLMARLEAQMAPVEDTDESECPACDSSGNDGVGPCPRGCIHSSVRRARES